MRHLTAGHRALLALFDQMYRPRVDGWSGALTLERTALPGPGGIEDQPARTMAALEVLEGVALEIWREQQARAKREHRGK